jgi:hypothetical protein
MGWFPPTQDKESKLFLFGEVKKIFFTKILLGCGHRIPGTLPPRRLPAAQPPESVEIRKTFRPDEKRSAGGVRADVHRRDDAGRVDDDNDDDASVNASTNSQSLVIK